MKILLAEDDTTIRQRLIQSVNNNIINSEITSYKSANETLCYAKQNKIDLFILDIQLTDYKGTHLAKQIRAIPEYKFTPIIFITALAGEELMAYRELKCYSFITKPFTEQEIYEALKEVQEYIENVSSKKKTIRIEQKCYIFEYDVNQISYIESYGKQILIHVKRNHTIEVDQIAGYSLKGMMELLRDCQFVQCHKSYLVNCNEISRIDKSNNIIYIRENEEPIPIGNKFRELILGER
ncbi:two-component response regulator [Lachnospiraceae bacterium KM106-2]|nr:two-component response regulator [Lachnospiraceae bacterium KM106-2]